MRRRWAVSCAVFLVAGAVAILQPAAAVAGPVGKTGLGYWEAQGSGAAVAFGDAGSLGGPVRDASGVVGIAAEPGGQGYLLVGADGRVVAFGAAKFYGSMAGARLSRPMVGIALTPSGRGYYLVASDGGVFSFGDVRFRGSTGGMRLNAPIVGMAVTPSGRGYWLVAADGGIFTFGDARFRGSAGGSRLRAPIVGMAATHDGRGYWLADANGAVRAYGTAHLLRSLTGRVVGPVVAIATSPSGNGYLLASKFGGVTAFGDAPSCYPSYYGKIPFRGPGAGNTVGIAIPFDAATIGTFLAGSCGGPSPAFHATAPFHVDFTPTNSRFESYCEVALLRANINTPTQNPVLDQLQGEAPGRLEIRSAQMAGNTTFRITGQPFCLAIARPGSGGTQSLPFTTTAGGDTLPFTSASPITIDGSSPYPCQVEVFADSDGHFVDGHYGSHAHIVVPAGTYFIQSDLECHISVS